MITEGEVGTEICRELFSSLEKVELCVQKLKDIAAFYKLEGWLINIENKVNSEMVSFLYMDSS